MPIIDALDLPTGAQIEAAGYHGAIGYSRVLRAEQLAELLEHVPMAVYFETTTNRVLSGEGAGHHDGQLANEQLDAIGWPKDAPVIYTADTFVRADQLHLVGEYLDAARAQGRSPWIYGGYDVVEYAINGGHADGGILAGAASWDDPNDPNGPPEYAAAQRATQTTIAGKTVDVLDVRLDNWGQTYGPNTPTTPVPPGTTPEDQPMTPEDRKYIDDKFTELAVGTVAAVANLGKLITDELNTVAAELKVAPLPPFSVNNAGGAGGGGSATLVVDQAAPTVADEPPADTPPAPTVDYGDGAQ